MGRAHLRCEARLPLLFALRGWGLLITGRGGAIADGIHNPSVPERRGLISTLPNLGYPQPRRRRRSDQKKKKPPPPPAGLPPSPFPQRVPTDHNRRRAALLPPRHASVFQATDAPGMGPLSAMPGADVWISWGDLSNYLTATQATIRESLV
ncbi:hypothetical protein PVAP13_8KG278526 [Panicum virgatum]|uniref:Uncharacterized protein n=1 Tax=Panicum virgatum TaxID=38727 RepID=A0A8T0PXI9_PANVG|nr:hypothetical protein PVAP13_8KG278526 [Panicum virgatum]